MTSFFSFHRPLRSHDYLKCLVALGIPSVGVVMGFLRQHSLFENARLAIFGLGVAFTFLLLVTVIAAIALPLGGKMGNVLGFTLLTGFAGVVSMFLFIAVGKGIDDWKVDSTRSYVAQAVTVLDQIKARDGAYPVALPVSLLGRPPELLRKYGRYSSNGKEFHFEYWDLAAGYAGDEDPFEFDSTNRHWIRGQ